MILEPKHKNFKDQLKSEFKKFENQAPHVHTKGFSIILL